MIKLTTAASIEAASLDPLVRSLIAQHMDRLSEFNLDLSEQLGRFVVIEPGDTLTAIETELGFSPLIDFFGCHFGEPGYAPSWEWAEDHGKWFELVYVLDDAGNGVVVFIASDPGIDPSLLALCIRWVSQGP